MELPWGILGYACDCLSIAATSVQDVIATAMESLEDGSGALLGLLGIMLTSFDDGPDMVPELFQYGLGLLGIVEGWIWTSYVKA